MIQPKMTPGELWKRQQMSSCDVDYEFWNQRRENLKSFAHLSQNCIFTVDVFKERYDFASDNFSHLFGYKPAWIRTIQQQGDLLEERIHPDDRACLIEYQIEHGEFIYSLPPEQRNDYQQIFQFRILDARQRYVNVTSRHQVIQKDRLDKAWIVMGLMDLSPDQIITGKVKRTVINRKTGEIFTPEPVMEVSRLTPREKEIFLLMRQGLFSKEIADRLNISIYTVHNHRKNILAKLNAGNVMEAIRHSGSGF